MPGHDTQPDSTTLRQDSPPSMVATNTLAALLTEPVSDLQKRREAYKRAAAARRERRAVAQFEQAFGHTDDCATVEDFDAECTCR